MEILSRGGECLSSNDDYCKLLEKKSSTETFSSLATISKNYKQLQQVWTKYELHLMNQFLPYAHGAVLYKHPNLNFKIDLMKSLDTGATVFDLLFKSSNNDVRELRKTFSSVCRIQDLEKRE